MLSDTQLMDYWLNKVIKEHEKNIVNDYKELEGKYFDIKEKYDKAISMLNCERDDAKRILASLHDSERKACGKQEKLDEIKKVLDNEVDSALKYKLLVVLNKQEG